MNYTNNVPCHTMKPLERKLFKMMIRRIDYTKVCENYDEVDFIMPSEEIIEHFCWKYGVSMKMAIYYLEKWAKVGIYKSIHPDGLLQYGKFTKLDILLGTDIPVFERERKKYHKYLQYMNAVPYRVHRQYFRQRMLMAKLE